LAGGGKSKLPGAKSLFSILLGIYEDICKEQGTFFQKSENSLELDGKLMATHYKIPGNISSQFITGLLYALPLLEQDSVLEVIPPVESKAYIEMTWEVLELFGIKVERKENTYYTPGNQTYQAVSSVVEGDYSNAAFLDAFNLIGGEVKVEGLKENSLQGDKIYKDYYQLLQQGSSTMDISECPDLGPILIGMAAAKQGAIFTGTKRLKIKESDRGAVMAEELKKFGIDVEVLENQIIVHPGKLQKPKELLDSHNDHRIAMTLATLCTITGGTIEDCMAVNKSYPGYYETIRNLGIQVEIKD
jgi:3-phosphoshikimate 1-carboxyvinyltransferase